MITERKLRSLKFGTRIRKTARLLEQFECHLRNDDSFDTGYLVMLLRLAGEDLDMRIPPESNDREAMLREVNRVRHAILAYVGKDPADWDLMPAWRTDDANVTAHSRTRTKEPANNAISVFLEDIRSPYNVGAIFRTAAAFGVGEIILSPDCASPEHPRAARTSMHATQVVPWRVGELSSVFGGSGELFALETGGTYIGDFVFPEIGTVILGNEELGISPETRRIVAGSAGICSIGLPGAKSSLNVSVAFGILAQRWYECITH